MNIEEFLDNYEKKELLRVLTCGSVDDGKSTLIGRLLYDTQLIQEDQLARLKNESVNRDIGGEEIDYSLLLDGLKAEREQGITIDVAYRYFSTPKRKFIIADTPGHEQYTRNMVTGASTSNVAIVLIDARKGVTTQTKRHSYILSLLQIKDIVVAINKMDLVQYSKERFEEIISQFRSFSDFLSFDSVTFIPISALKGDNVVEKSTNMEWYNGQSLLEFLENISVEDDYIDKPFRFPVQWVNRPNLDFRGYSGTVESGRIEVGDEILVLPSYKKSTVKKIIAYKKELKEAFYKQAVTIQLNDEIDISSGDLIVKSKEKYPKGSKNIIAHLVWLDEEPLELGKIYTMRYGSREVKAKVVRIDARIDVNNFSRESVTKLRLNEIGIVHIATLKDVFFDKYEENRNTGSFILIDPITNATSGAGMVINPQSNISEIVFNRELFNNSLIVKGKHQDKRLNIAKQKGALILVLETENGLSHEEIEILEEYLLDKSLNCIHFEFKSNNWELLKDIATLFQMSNLIAITSVKNIDVEFIESLKRDLEVIVVGNDKIDKEYLKYLDIITSNLYEEFPLSILEVLKKRNIIPNFY